MDQSDETVFYCRRCRRALNLSTYGTGAIYWHAIELRGGTVDHPADPVPLAELSNAVMQCDFCSGPGPTWVYVGADQHTEHRRVTAKVVGLGDYRDRRGAARALRIDTAPGISQSWGQRWSACQECAVFIEQRDVYGLIRRVVESMPSKLVQGKRLIQVRGQLHTTYSHLFATLTPGRGRITPNNPLGVWEPAQPTAQPGGPASHDGNAESTIERPS
ncbi:MAG: hypothetical protein ACRDSE_00140 [Pseudonocardiaceae bacterium]